VKRLARWQRLCGSLTARSFLGQVEGGPYRQRRGSRRAAAAAESGEAGEWGEVDEEEGPLAYESSEDFAGAPVDWLPLTADAHACR
jgi:hypothetical protein